jgi:hypothetical protein
MGVVDDIPARKSQNMREFKVRIVAYLKTFHVGPERTANRIKLQWQGHHWLLENIKEIKKIYGISMFTKDLIFARRSSHSE